MKILALLGFAALFAFATPRTTSLSESERAPFRVAWQDFPNSLLYYTGYDEYSYAVTSLVLESLLRENEETNLLEEGLAKNWHQEKSGKIQITLNPHAKFADGTPVTAEDVAATFRAITSATAQAPILAAQLRLLGECRVENKMRLHFKPPPGTRPSLRILTEFFILPEKLMQSKPSAITALQKSFVGSGPYQIDEVVWGESVILKKRNDYWRVKLNKTHFHFPRIQMKKVADPAIQLAMLKRGELDYVYVTSAKAWEEDFQDVQFETSMLKKLRVTNQLPYATVGIAWNTKRPLFQDARVRRALSHLIDRERMISQLFYQHYVPATGIFHTKSKYHSPQNHPIPFNPQVATTLLNEAGWIPDPKNGIRKRNGIPFQFEILAPAAAQRFLTIYQENLRSVGIEMKILTLDWTTYLERTRNRDFDAAQLSRNRDIEPENLSLTWGTESASVTPSLNATGYSDTIIEAALKSAAHSPEKALAQYRKIDERIAETQPMSFLWEPTFFRIAYRNKVTLPTPEFYAYSRWYNLFHRWKPSLPQMSSPVASRATP